MIKLFQIYYDRNQEHLLESSTEWLFNNNISPAAEREFGIMRDLYQKRKIFDSSTEYAGFISWKFKEKARITGQDFLNGIRSKAGYDVYILNPFPEANLYSNTWLHGESHHPGLILMAQKLVEAAGLEWKLANIPGIIQHNSYCNFWVANRKFWDIFMKHALLLAKTIQENSFFNEKFFSPAPGGNLSAPYHSFFFERLIGTVLFYHPEIRVYSFNFPKEWYRRHYRSDIADFLYNLPRTTPIDDVDHADFIARLSSVRNSLLHDPTFHFGSHRTAGLMGKLNQHPNLKRLLRNPITISVKRLLWGNPLDSIRPASTALE